MPEQTTKAAYIIKQSHRQLKKKVKAQLIQKANKSTI